MTKTVQVAKTVPVAPFWFENIQVVSKLYTAPGPQYPRGYGNARS